MWLGYALIANAEETQITLSGFAEGALPIVSIRQNERTRDLALPLEFMNEIGDTYEEVHVEDLNGDGQNEVVFQLPRGGANSCVKVLNYDRRDDKLIELVFRKGGLCNYTITSGQIISSYRNRAKWIDDVYEIKHGVANLILSDESEDLGQKVRTLFENDGVVKFLVTDSPHVDDRVPITATVITPKARIYLSPENAAPTKKYLIAGDEVSILGFETSQWVNIRFQGNSITEGWLKSGDVKSDYF
jgi:hypothetical protein